MYSDTIPMSGFSLGFFLFLTLLLLPLWMPVLIVVLLLKLIMEGIRDRFWNNRKINRDYQHITVDDLQR